MAMLGSRCSTISSSASPGGRSGRTTPRSVIELRPLHSPANARDDPEMRVIGAFGQLVLLGTLFALGGVLGIAIGVVVFPISFYRGARAVHADGVVCRGEIIAHDAAIAAL